MKKSMLNVIILALVLVNLVLTVILTFSLVSTNKKTNSLINKVAQIIDLDVAGGVSNNNSSTGSGIENVSYIDIKNNDSTDYNWFHMLIMENKICRTFSICRT
mgnify:CR=1 FL=1